MEGGWRPLVPWPLCQRTVSDGVTEVCYQALTLLASSEPAAQLVYLHPWSLPHAISDPRALLFNTLFLPRCSPPFPEQTLSCPPTAAPGLVSSFLCWLLREGCSACERQSHRAARCLVWGREEEGQAWSNLITSSHPTNATGRRWLGLESHL